MDCEVVGKRPRGRPEKTWKDLAEKDLIARGFSWGDAADRERWREGVHGCKWPTPAQAGNAAIKHVCVFYV